MKINSIQNFKFQNNNNNQFRSKSHSTFELPTVYSKDFRDAYVSVMKKSQTEEATTNPLLATVNKLKTFLKGSFEDEVYHEFNDVKKALEEMSYDRVA